MNQKHNKMIQSILVTGGCGFIGTSLIRKFVERWPNLQIRVLDSLFTGKPDDLAEVTSFTTISTEELPGFDRGVALIEGDIRDSEFVQLCTQNVDSIVHLAANTGVQPSVDNPRLDMECNVLGTFNMLEAARLNGVKKFIFASSGAPAGQVEPPIHEELPPHPVSPYPVL